MTASRIPFLLLAAQLFALGFASGQAPTITSVNPSSIPAGATSTLTVQGSGFQGTPTVFFGPNSYAISASSATATSLTVDIPASQVGSAGSYGLTVANPPEGPFSNSLNVTVIPTITSLSPAQVSAGSYDFTLTVNGTGFAGGSGTSVNWNGTALPTTYNSSTQQLTATVPAADLRSPGVFPVTSTLR